jgi:hypothetical protein
MFGPGSQASVEKMKKLRNTTHEKNCNNEE